MCVRVRVRVCVCVYVCLHACMRVHVCLQCMALQVLLAKSVHSSPCLEPGGPCQYHQRQAYLPFDEGCCV